MLSLFYGELYLIYFLNVDGAGAMVGSAVIGKSNHFLDGYFLFTCAVEIILLK